MNLKAWRQSIDLREFGVSALLAAVVLFVAAMVMLDTNVAQLRHSFAQSEQAYAIQKQIVAVGGRMNGVEMTVRGYALTGDPKFLERYRQCRDDVLRAMGELRGFTAAEPALQPDFAVLESAVARHRALYARLIGHGPDRQDVVAEAISNPDKRRHSARANNALSRIETTQLRLQRERRTTAEREAQKTYGLAIAIAGVAFLTGTLGFALTLFGRQRESNSGTDRRSPA